MQYDIQRADDEAGEPSLEEMTEKAIRVLSRNPKGYFLLVEGGLSSLLVPWAAKAPSLKMSLCSFHTRCMTR